MTRFRRALVTGGAGFIGSRLAEALLAEGLEVVVLDDLSMGRREAVPRGARLEVGDVRDADAVGRALEGGVDVVFHQAAIVSVRLSLERFVDDAATNLLGTLNVFHKAIEAGARRFVFASSMAVYGDSEPGTRALEGRNEEPVSPYGLAKLSAERYLTLLAAERDVEVFCLRYFNVYGENQTPTPYVGVMTIFVDRLLAGQPPRVFGDGGQTRDFVYVGDVVRANLAALAAEGPGGVFNVATGRGTSVLELARLLCSRIDGACQPELAPAVPGELYYSVGDLEAARSGLGFAARERLEDRIDEVIRARRARRARAGDDRPREAP